MKHARVLFALLVILLALALLYQKESEQAPVEQAPVSENQADVDRDEIVEYRSDKGVVLKLHNPIEHQVIDSPLVVEGEAPGFWFFEATFPVTLVNWDGLIIAEYYVEAEGDWMTEDFVPFRGELSFEDIFPLTEEKEELDALEDFQKQGYLILRKSNASGLPEHDDAVEIPVKFAE